MDDYQGGEGGGELVHYFEAPFRRPLAVLIPLVIAVTVSIIAGRVMPKSYRATTVILVEGEKVPDGLAKRVTPGGNLQTLKQEVLSRTRLEQVIRELDPNVKEERLANLVDKMRRGIRIGVKGNDSFTLEFDDPDPKRAMEVTNKLAAVFIENAGQARAEQVAETYEFIVSQLEEARKALEAHETAVVRFKERNMGHLPEQTSANLATLQRLQSEKQSAEANLRAAQDKVEQLEKNPAAGAAGPGGELAGLRNKLAELRLRYTDEHPDVRTLMVRIQHLEELAAERGGPSPEERSEASLTAARELIEKLKAKSESLEEKISGFQARVDGAPRLEQELTALNRDYAKLQSNYQAMLNKKMDAEMAGKLEERWKGGQFRILDPAVLPRVPTFPNKTLFVLIGILAGLVLGVVVALGLEVIDPSIKSVSDLENFVPFPVLATLPRVKAAKRAASPARKRAQSA